MKTASIAQTKGNDERRNLARDRCSEENKSMMRKTRNEKRKGWGDLTIIRGIDEDRCIEGNKSALRDKCSEGNKRYVVENERRKRWDEKHTICLHQDHASTLVSGWFHMTGNTALVMWWIYAFVCCWNMVSLLLGVVLYGWCVLVLVLWSEGYYSSRN